MSKSAPPKASWPSGKKVSKQSKDATMRYSSRVASSTTQRSLNSYISTGQSKSMTSKHGQRSVYARKTAQKSAVTTDRVSSIKFLFCISRVPYRGVQSRIADCPSCIVPRGWRDVAVWATSLRIAFIGGFSFAIRSRFGLSRIWPWFSTSLWIWRCLQASWRTFRPLCTVR